MLLVITPDELIRKVCPSAAAFRGADDRTGSWPVFNYNGLSQALADGIARHPRDQIVCAAGPERNDPTDGVIRPFRARLGSAPGAHGKAGRKKQGPPRGCTSARLVFRPLVFRSAHALTGLLIR
jgi:hypothetical protein